MTIDNFVNKIFCGNSLDVLKDFPDKSVDCVITSPAYWQLRDYKWDGQWGMEPTFQLYLENLWSLMDEVWRVLKDTGTCWINLGDTYSSSGGPQVTQTAQKNSGFEWTNSGVQQNRKDISYGVRNKCLLLIPHRFAIGCIDRGWIMRNDCVWAKRNGMPESVTDRFTKKHEFFFFMTKKESYYFDLAAIKDKTKSRDFIIRDRETTKLNNTPGRTKMGGLKENNYETKNPGTVSVFWDNNNKETFGEYMQRCSDYWHNPDDLFDVTTTPSSDEHYAAYNNDLILKPIYAGCPEDGIILDPFCGTATTGCVALKNKRKFIGIDGSEKYVEIANANIKNLLKEQWLF